MLWKENDIMAKEMTIAEIKQTLRKRFAEEPKKRIVMAWILLKRHLTHFIHREIL